jgi:CheY-like chemotaxis protein
VISTGAVAYLEKPFEIDTLAQMVQQHLV